LPGVILDEHRLERALADKLGLDPDQVVAGSMHAEIRSAGTGKGATLEVGRVTWTGAAEIDPQELVDLVNDVIKGP
jgi:hypothetical protein